MTGLELKIKRIQKGMKQKVLAKILRVTPAYVCMMESGKVSIPEEIYSKWVKILDNDN